MKMNLKLGKLPVLAIGLVAVIAVAVFAVMMAGGKKQDDKNVVTISTLEKIIDVSDLSTFTAVYNGVAQVMNEEKPEKVDYYVSYEAEVKAGIDFEKIQVSLEEESKTIRVVVPEVKINSTEVDIGSLDFIFYNDKANQSTVTQTAYEACKADVQEESASQTAIYELAKKNAVNVLTALMKPVVDQMEQGYTLTVE